MVVNTINELIALLDLVDQDATVLAAIANDSPTSLASGPSEGLVTTRLGTDVKNVQKVIADIKNGILIGIRPAIQEEGDTILDNAAIWNFVGGNITVTDISGVATITVIDAFNATFQAKLSGIEASADVTDAANVTAAGALMDSELTDIASVKALDQGVAEVDTPTFAGIITSGNVDGRDVAADGTKLDYVTVTQAVNLDTMETDINALSDGMTYEGDWDASSGTFPGAGAAATGGFYYVFVDGIVDNISFTIGDNIVAIVDNASTSIYASNWSKHDQTDAVSAVVGLTGSVSKSGLLAGLNVEDGATADQTGAEIATALSGETISGLILTGSLTTGALTASGIITADAGLVLGDNDKIKLGDSDDLQLYHDGTNSYIKNTTGQIFINKSGPSNAWVCGVEAGFTNPDDTEFMVRATSNGPVKLYHNGSEKLATSASGIDVTGDVTATGLTTDFGTIGVVNANNMFISGTATNHAGVQFGTGNVTPYNNGSESDGGVDLGAYNLRWNNLYLSGVARLGTGTTYATIEGKSNSDLEFTANAGQINGAPNITFRSSNAGGSITEHLRIDNSGNVSITSGDLDVTGDVDLTTNLKIGGTTVLNSGRSLYNLTQIKLADSYNMIFGSGNDLQIYHDGANSHITSTTGVLNITSDDLRLKSSGGAETMLRAVANGAVELMHNNDQKIVTTATGVDVTGTVTADGLTSSSAEYDFSALTLSSAAGGGANIDFTLEVGDTGISGLYSKNLVIKGSSGSSDIAFSPSTSYPGLMVLDGSAGNVGIGTSNPLYKLDISGTTNTIGVRVSSNTANDTLYYGTGTVTGDMGFFGSNISATGNLSGTVQNTNTSVGNAVLSTNVPASSSGDPYLDLTINGAVNWTVGVDNSDSDKFKIGPNSSPSNGTASLTIDTSGNVGIGKTPTTKLDVDGNVQFGDGGGFDMNVDGTRWQFSIANDEKMRIDSSGNVDIKTGGANLKLAYNSTDSHSANLGWRHLQLGNNGFNYIVAGNSATGGGLRFVVNNTTDLSTNNGTSHNGIVAMAIDSSGNVSIPSDSAKLKLGVGEDLQLYHDGSNSYITNNTGVLNVTNNDFRLKTSGAETMLRAVANGAVELMHNSSTKLATTASGIDVTGNVTAGISGVNANNYQIKLLAGTTGLSRFIAGDGSDAGYLDYNHDDDSWSIKTASAERLSITSTRLTVKGVIRSENGSAGEIQLYNGTSERATFKDENTGAYIGTSVGMPMYFGTNSTRQMVLDGDKVGIGTLSVQANTALTVEGATTENTWYALKVQNSAQGNLFTVRNDGKVGIGTDDPAQVLHVKGANPIRFERAGVGYAELGIDNVSGVADAVIYPRTNGSGVTLKYLTTGGNTTNGLVLDETGKVGIGTTTPAYPLEVSGIARAAHFYTNTGSESVPVFAPQGNTNDGIFFPSGGNIGFTTAGAEAMRITSGKVGIGTGSPSGLLHLAKLSNDNPFYMDTYSSNQGHVSTFQFRTSKQNTIGNTHTIVGTNLGRVEWYGNTGSAFVRSGYIAMVQGSSTETDGDLTINAGGHISLATGGSESLHIDNSGNVGIGVVPEAWNTSVFSGVAQLGPQGVLATTSTTMQTGVNWYYDGAYKRIGTGYASRNYQSDGAHVYETAASGAADSAISWSEALRIDSSGNVLVGKTTTGVSGVGAELRDGASDYAVTGTSSASAVALFNRTVDTGVLIRFRQANTPVGDISVTGSTTSYNESSDYRLKEDIQPMVGASERVLALNPINFAWKLDGSRVDGFLAHEAQEVVPNAVTGTKDAMMTEEYEVSAALGEVFTPAIDGIDEVTETVVVTQSVEAQDAVMGERQVTETIESVTYVNLAGETIIETREVGVTEEATETVIERQVAALGEVFTPAIDGIDEVTETVVVTQSVEAQDAVMGERQVTETIESVTYVNLAGETIIETREVGVTEEATETVIERQEIDGIMTEVEVERTVTVAVMEVYEASPAVEAVTEVTEVNVITESVEAIAEVVLEIDVERPTEFTEQQQWRETTAGVMSEVEVERTVQVPVMETYEASPAVEAVTEVTEVNVITESVEAIAEVVLEIDVERPTEFTEQQQWRETAAQVMAEREVPDMQGIDQAKIVPLLVAALQETVAALQEAVTRIESLEQA